MDHRVPMFGTQHGPVRDRRGWQGFSFLLTEVPTAWGTSIFFSEAVVLYPTSIRDIELTTRDPNDTGAAEYPYYHAFESGETSVFPFHDACYEISARSLELTDTEEVDKDILYNVLESYRAEDTPSYLDLDHRYLDFFLWLEAVTEAKMGIKGPVLGIANRRRIWSACQQLVCDYQERVGAHHSMHVGMGSAPGSPGHSRCFYV